MMQARMRQAYVLAVVVVASVVVLGGTAFAQSGTPTNIGTWKMNVAKSKYNPGPAPKSGTIKYEATGAGVRVTVDSVAADGTATHSVSTSDFDGKDSPITNNNPNGADMIARTRINANTTQSVSKKGGKVTTTGTYVVSSDGKTMTVTTTGTNAQGQKVNHVVVYDKQ
jgi:hypothetical protein